MRVAVSKSLTNRHTHTHARLEFNAFPIDGMRMKTNINKYLLRISHKFKQKQNKMKNRNDRINRISRLKRATTLSMTYFNLLSDIFISIIFAVSFKSNESSNAPFYASYSNGVFTVQIVEKYLLFLL